MAEQYLQLYLYLFFVATLDEEKIHVNTNLSAVQTALKYKPQ